MAYNANIPMATDQLSQSQLDIQQNFQALKALIDVNHVDFAAGDEGKHKWITLPSQGAIPPAGSGFLAGELALYNATSPVTSQPELYINKTNQATVVQVPSTASILSTNSAPGPATAGWTYIPSGLLLKWGTVTLGGVGAQIINFPVSGTIPVFTQVIQGQLTIYTGGVAADPNTAVSLVTFTNTTFTVWGSQRTATVPAIARFNYLMIGF